MRKLALSFTLLALLAPLAYAAKHEVRVDDNFFKPEKLTIIKGDKVTWKWKGSDIHTVSMKKPGEKEISKASPLKTEGTYSYKFRRLGKWRILCETHPKKMRMRVIVKAP
ncbi:MAG TPA: plastocyanin/azurin family copper-binding protein [Thermoleophilaceae bacterium]|nr:plastocyanin/azurin family copper-binding protein [Thermoleophilaceae bacterium]